jgi:hypothetical protein
MFVGFCCVGLRDRDNLGDLGVDGTMAFKWILQRQNGRAWKWLCD